MEIMIIKNETVFTFLKEEKSNDIAEKIIFNKKEPRDETDSEAWINRAKSATVGNFSSDRDGEETLYQSL